jgi:dodecin
MKIGNLNFFTPSQPAERRIAMPVASISELKASSTKSFDDAIKQGVKRASKTLRNIKSAWIVNQEVVLGENGVITEYRVHLKVTFVLDD